MELKFKNDIGSMGGSVDNFGLTDFLSGDSFTIYNNSIVYKICLRNEEGEGHITLRDNYDKKQKKKSLDITYDSEYYRLKTLGIPCDYYNYLEINSFVGKDKNHKTIEIPKESITNKNLL